MLFKYKSVDEGGIAKEGEIDASTRDMAISGLQHRGLIVISLIEADKAKSFFKLSFFEKIKMRDIVIFSRQISTLFEAQVSALKAFSMLASNAENKLLGTKLTQITDDLQAGVSISGALAKHPDTFSDFYVNMVKAGEEVGTLNQTFLHLADYLDRQYAITTKTKNALIYPALVILTFFIVMGLMLTVVIPKLAVIITSTGQEPPFFTKVIIWLSDFFVHYGILVLIFVILAGVYLWWLSLSERGKNYLDRVRFSVPVLGNLFRKLYLARIADNLDTMLVSGIPIVKSIDITSKVTGNRLYENILKEVSDSVKSGIALSTSFEKYPDYIPNIMIQMMKVGEETGSLGPILKTLADFYKREVDTAIDTLITLIEPIMIVVLGLGVGILLVSVLMPIYNLAGSF